MLSPALYQRFATQYDQDRDRSLFEKSWLDRFLAHVTPGGTVLDLGCGMGEPIARYVVEQGFHVAGMDSSLAMIQRCATRFPEQKWLVADMRQSPLNRRFDGVLAWDSFFHLTGDEQRSMIPVFARHSEPGAPLMFTSGPAEGVAIGSYHGAELYHASLDPMEYRELLEANGFEIVDYIAHDTTCGDHTVWLARRNNI